MANTQTTAQKAAAAKEQPKPSKPVPPPEFKAERIAKLDQAGLIKLLKDRGATEFEKAKACQRLAIVGAADAAPALAALLTDAKLSHYARYGLEAIPGPAADDALRQALPKVKGMTLVGVINSVGRRKDAKAVPALSKLMYDNEADVAQAAAAAIGAISGVQAAKALQDGLGRTKGKVRAAVAGAGLVCAEGLLAAGQRDEALALYDTLSRTDIPKPARLAAMQGIIAAEISLSRPR